MFLTLENIQIVNYNFYDIQIKTMYRKRGF